jgi:hypothetical protein
MPRVNPEEVAKITQQNLTSLPCCTRPDDGVLFDDLNVRLTALNEMAKPGGGLELTVFRGGRIEWSHYDAVQEDLHC